MKKLFFLIILFISLENEAQFHVSFRPECYGVIMSDSISKVSYFLGTGFVIDSNIVVTCYHVFHDPLNKPKYFHNIKSDQAIPIVLIDSFPEQDIAIYKTDYNITKQPMELGSLSNLIVGDSILYAGYDLSKKSNYFSFATILQRDSIISNGFIIERIIFEGDVIGGYSGGPIFDKKNKVIGMLTNIVRRRTDYKTLRVIGYSVEPLLKKGF